MVVQGQLDQTANLAGHPRPSQAFQKMLDEWQDLERQAHLLICALDANPANDDQDPQALDYIHLDRQEEELVQRQHDLLSQLAGTPADNLADLHTKLMIWRSIAAPEPVSETHASQPDKLVLSVCEDLSDELMRFKQT